MLDAYMIRQDGCLFPVMIHWYLPSHDLYFSCEAGEWLCKAAKDPMITAYYIPLVAYFLKKVLNLDVYTNETINDALSLYGYPVSMQFIQENFVPIINEISHSINDNIEQILLPLRNIMDEEFIRERIGGMYETNFGCKDVYFRITSDSFNWLPVIKDFVRNNKQDIETVTIVKHLASTGEKDAYYAGPIGEYKFMPVDVFLRE